MTNATLIQQKIYKGYGLAAKRLGYNFDIYRSATAINPLNAGNKIGNILVGIDQKYTYENPIKYGDRTYQALVDGREVRPFDFLVSNNTSLDDSVYFIASMFPLLPIVIQGCNYVATVTRPKTTTKGFNENYYSGYTQDNVDVIYQNCPCTMLESRQGEASPAKLPAGVKQPVWRIYMPYLGNTQINVGDFIENDKQERFSIISNELTDLGWRIIAVRIGT